MPQTSLSSKGRSKIIRRRVHTYGLIIIIIRRSNNDNIRGEHTPRANFRTQSVPGFSIQTARTILTITLHEKSKTYFAFSECGPFKQFPVSVPLNINRNSKPNATRVLSFSKTFIFGVLLDYYGFFYSLTSTSRNVTPAPENRVTRQNTSFEGRKITRENSFPMVKINIK